MSEQSPGGFSCLGCGGCLAVLVIGVGIAAYAIAGIDWMPPAVAAAVVVAFLIGFVALERARK
jgi:NO-binding membrane sensor protein with MHYT domain